MTTMPSIMISDDLKSVTEGQIQVCFVTFEVFGLTDGSTLLPLEVQISVPSHGQEPHQLQLQPSQKLKDRFRHLLQMLEDGVPPLRYEDSPNPQLSLAPETGPQAKVYNGAIHRACGGAERWSRNGGDTRRPASFGSRWKHLKPARELASCRVNTRFMPT